MGAFYLALCLLIFPSAKAYSDVSMCSSLQAENYTCSACISLHPQCAWCSDLKFETDHKGSRCMPEYLLAGKCGAGYIVNPRSDLKVTREEPLSKGTDVPEESVVQITPQEVVIYIRPRDTVQFPIWVGQPVNYPVDLYYLMDLSHSMQDDKDKLSELGGKLAARMSTITKNFHLGFGSFVDKKVMPFVDPRPEKMNSPCDGCVEPYGFKHHMSLSTDANKFKHEVNASKVSGNLDAPEGGFDAIIQALSCDKQIGWRDKSRKMLVFSTDAGFHYAGDGRLGGLVVPNDDKCWLDERGYYSKSTEFDYPSVGQVHKKIRDTQANVIFAVTEEQRVLYQRLQHALPDVSTSVGVLRNDSGNIVTLIEDEYNRITEKITLLSDLGADSVLNVSYTTPCNGSIWEQKSHCSDVKVGDVVPFNVSVYLSKCVKEDIHFMINRAGLAEGIRVTVKPLCECDCQDPEHVPDVCLGRGKIKCGVCDCVDGYIGVNCDCNTTGVSSVQLDMRCRKDNDSEICSGRGQCSCGRCICDPRPNNESFYGQFCECADFNCPRRDRVLCSGRGNCTCNGECACQPEWKGAACECPASDKGCLAPNGKICNNRGDCVCGVCKCDKDYRYSGGTCEICVTCPRKCEELRQCVLCYGFQSGQYNETQCALNCPYQMERVDDHTDHGGANNESVYDCQYVDQADDCTFYFRYRYDENTNHTAVWIKRKKDCPPPLPILAIVLGVIAGIVLIGLVLLLIWKLLTVIHDRREYAKFENERLMARWDTGENPIFHPATTTFKNPAYGVK